MSKASSVRSHGWRALVAAVAGVAVLTLGVGSASATTVSATKYVTVVCAAQKKVTSRFKSQQSALNTALASGDAAGIKTAVVNAVKAAIPALKTLASSLKRAGEPKVANGKQIAEAYLSTVQSVAAMLPAAKTQAAALPTTSLATLNTALQGIITPIQTATQSGNDRASTLDRGAKVAKAIGNRCGLVGSLGGGGSGTATPTTGGSAGAGAPVGSPSGGSSGGPTATTGSPSGGAPAAGTPSGGSGGGAPPAPAAPK